MSMAIANPDELRQFANILSKYLETITDETNMMHSAFVNLQDTWQDQQTNKFDDILKQLLNVLSQFKEEAYEQIPRLNQMAEDLETYLGR